MTSFPRRRPEAVRRIVIPQPPQPPPTHTFPIMATVAPVLGAVALWAMTLSPYVLAFAALGPVIAIASVGDARMGSRRSRRSELARFDRDCGVTRDLIALAHLNERAELGALAPGPRELLSTPAPNPERWRAVFSAPIPLRIGEGSVPSAVHIEGDVTPDADRAIEVRRGELRDTAAVVTSAPVIVDARLGVGLIGTEPLLLAAARGLLVQLCAQLSPASVRIVAPVGAEWEWLAELPHAVADSPPGPRAPAGLASVTFVDDNSNSIDNSNGGGPSLTIAIASRADDLPRQCRIVLQFGGTANRVENVSPAGLQSEMVRGVDAEIIRHPDELSRGTVRVVFVSEREARGWATIQYEIAQSVGMRPAGTMLPAVVALADLLPAPTLASANLVSTPESGLACVIGIGEEGAVSLDLVRDGPHAIVGGTTGSGKSELLVSWVVAMAASRSPQEVTFLFVDFKGGAAFEPLRTLPHGVGVITDLDVHEAVRALSSLRAEVRYRERFLAAAGARSIDDHTAGIALPRLVLVVDEYAAMLDEHPEMHTLFSDLAARGRSLGIHLILCTQRPGGAVRESILANCGLRISLRVNNPGDSVSVLSTDAAARLPAVPVGRAIMRVLGGPPCTVQVARTAPTDISRLSHRWAHLPPPRRPWCAPLPELVSFRDLGDGAARRDANGIPFALRDLPDEQRRDIARWEPVRDGALLVVGAGGSGKSGVLDALRAAPTLLQVDRVGSALPAVWDSAQIALSGARPPSSPNARPPRILLLDDVDALVASCPDEYAVALAELLTRLVREGPAHGVAVVLTAQRLHGALQPIAALCGSTLLLHTSSRQEHLLAGGESDHYDPHLPPGAGTWRGHRVQVVAPSGDVAATATVGHTNLDLTATIDDGVPLAVVSTRPRELAERLRVIRPERAVLELGAPVSDPVNLLVSVGDEPTIPVGDPEAWLARWGALAAFRESTNILFDGCSTGEFRALTGRRDIPPPVALGSRPLWLLDRTDRVHRANWGDSRKAPDTRFPR